MSEIKRKRPKVTGDDRLPGDADRETMIERMIRVDHAGEFGAARIYKGQLAVLGKTPVGDTIRHMAKQEEAHLAAFEELLAERRVRPTMLSPIWHAAGFALGAATAAMSAKVLTVVTRVISLRSRSRSSGSTLESNTAGWSARCAMSRPMHVIAHSLTSWSWSCACSRRSTIA